VTFFESFLVGAARYALPSPHAVEFLVMAEDYERRRFRLRVIRAAYPALFMQSFIVLHTNRTSKS